MQRWAIIHDGAVENIIVWDGVTPYAPPPGRLMMPEAEAARRGFRRPEAEMAAALPLVDPAGVMAPPEERG